MSTDPDDPPCTRVTDPDMFMPNPSDDAGIRKAIGVCAGCRPRVRAACYSIALRDRQLIGVWGGTYFAYGRHLPIRHGSANGGQQHRMRGEQPCEECRVREAADAKMTRDRRRQREQVPA